MRAMGAKSRRKGCRGEREAADAIQQLFGVEARRGCQYHGGPDSPDVQTAIAGVHWEVKRCESLRLYAALDQAIADAGSNIPVVLHRSNHRPWVAIVRLSDLPQLTRCLATILNQHGETRQ